MLLPSQTAERAGVTFDTRVFHAKTRILHNRLDRIEPIQYMETVFGESMAAPTLAVDAKRTSFRRFPTRLAAWNAACQNDGLFLSYCDFFGVNTVETLRQLHAFVVDIDDVDAGDLALRLASFDEASTAPQPSFIVNSGKGVHYIYALDAPVQCFKRNMGALRGIHEGLKALCRLEDQLGRIGKVDATWLGQPLRMPGTPTKMGLPAQAYKLAGRHSVDALAAHFGVALLPTGAPLPTSHARKKAPKQKRATHTGNPALAGWYQTTLARAQCETPRGTRYNSLTALAVIGWKAAVPARDVEHDLLALARHWTRRDGSPVSPAEVRKAMRMHSEKFRTVRAVTLEHWLGFTFPRRQKSTRVTLRQKLEASITAHQSSGSRFTTSEIAQELGVAVCEVSRLVTIKAGGRGVFWKG